MKEYSTVERLLAVQWYPDVVLVILHEVVLLLRWHFCFFSSSSSSSSLISTLGLLIRLVSAAPTLFPTFL